MDVRAGNMMDTPPNKMEDLLAEVRQCVVCAESLGHEPRPVLAAHRQSKIAIIGQAPGAVVHRSGVPWDDKSGENLRRWMEIDKSIFYDEKQIALIPMGFCYPGKGKAEICLHERSARPSGISRCLRGWNNSN